MKKIGEHLGQIIIAIAGITIIITAIVIFKAPVSTFFSDIVSKENNISHNVLSSIKGEDLYFTVPNKNYFENSEWIYGKALNTTSGIEYDSEKHSVSDFIPITPGTTYEFLAQFNVLSTKELSIYYFTADETLVSRQSTYSGYDYETINRIFTVPNNTNIAYAKFVVHQSSNGASQESLIPSKTELFNVEELKSNGKSFAGKTIVGFGDVITQGNKQSRSYLYQVAEKYHMQSFVWGSSNSTITAIKNRDDNISNFIDNVPFYAKITTYTGNYRQQEEIKPDYFVFSAGDSDFYYLNSDPSLFGAISDGFDATLDTSTFCGGFEAFVKTLKTNWPDAKILYVTPYIIENKDYEIQKKSAELAAQMCQKWDVEFVDVFNESGLDGRDEELTLKYIDKSVGYDVCPNTLGYKKFYLPIFSQALMKTLN